MPESELAGKWAARLLDGLFPQHCALCGLRSERALPLCATCEAELPANRHSCSRCAVPLPPGGGGVPCGRCLAHPPAFERAVAPWLYDAHMAHLIQRWKYRRETWLTPLLAQLWRQQAPLSGALDLIVPVPLHWRRQWWRGFNQAELLASALCRTLPELQAARLAPRLVRRTRATPRQSGIGAAGRAGNLRGAFTVCGPCANLRVAVVDDVLTTGATAQAVARALARAGAGPIEVWCLARTPAPGA